MIFQQYFLQVTFLLMLLKVSVRIYKFVSDTQEPESCFSMRWVSVSALLLVASTQVQSMFLGLLCPLKQLHCVGPCQNKLCSDTCSVSFIVDR